MRLLSPGLMIELTPLVALSLLSYAHDVAASRALNEDVSYRLRSLRLRERHGASMPARHQF